MKLHCSTSETHPIRLVDVTELFFRELRARGVEQTWYCQPAANPGPLQHRHPDGHTDIDLIVPPTFVGKGLASKLATRCTYWLLETWLLTTRLWNRVDAIVVRDKYWGALYGLLIARLSGVRFLIWLSYPFPEHERESARDARGLRRALLDFRAFTGEWMLYRIAMRRADHCFVQSEQMKKDLALRGIRPERMTAVPMGIRRSFFDDEASKPQQAMAHPSTPTVLHLGSLAAVRRLEVLVDAFAIVARARPDTRFEFVGDGDFEHERERLARRAREAGIADRVEFTGFLPIAQAWTHVAAASVCVSPFRVTPVLRVASPTKFIEYLAFAKPTVANDHPEHSMIARACEGARIADWSPEGFAKEILWCLDHPDEARAMGRRGREWVRANRTYDRLADLVHQRLEAVIAGADPNRDV